MELRDPYPENIAEQRRQGAPGRRPQARALQGCEQKVESIRVRTAQGGTQRQDVQLYEFRREGAQRQVVQGRTSQGRTVQGHGRQGAGAQARAAKGYGSQGGTRPQVVQGHGSQSSARGNGSQGGNIRGRAIQGNTPQREGVQLQNMQPYRTQGSNQSQNVQPQNTQVRRLQGGSTRPQDIQLYTPQREGVRSRTVQACRPRGESALPQRVQGRTSQVSARGRAVQGCRPETVPGAGVRGRDAQNRRAAALRRRKRRYRQMLTLAAMSLVVAVLGCMLLVKGYQVLAAEPKPHEIPHRDSSGLAGQGGLVQGIPAAEFAKRPEMEENFLTPNEYSRPGEALSTVKNVFVHYTANPGTSAAQNRNYFEQQKDSHENSVSAHFVIGCEGEIIQCVPLNEIAYAVAGRNYDSVSIECCHKTEDGSFTRETYDSLIGLLAWLTDVYDLDSEDILRHYDSNGKLCPLYYTEHPEAWEQLKEDVETFRKRPSR